MVRRFAPFFALLLSFVLAAQEGFPSPAPELKKLEPLVGNWQGSGTATFGPGAPPTKWTARGTYRWCLGGHWLREDFGLAFEEMPQPLVMRSYWGWDRENGRHVVLTVSNNGLVRLEDAALLPDGTLLQVMLMRQEGVPFAERATLKVEGDKLLHSVTMLLPEGPSLTIVDGHFTRGGTVFDGQWDAPNFEKAAPAQAMQKLGKCVGQFALTGEVVMAPGAPVLKIQGTDTFRSVFGGTVMHGTTVGSAEGMPGQYEGDVFWAFDAHRKCLVAGYVSNMGEVATMDGWFADDGKLLSTSHGTMRGQPMVQRMVMEMDAEGRPKGVVSHSILGEAAPFESFRATYAKK